MINSTCPVCGNTQLIDVFEVKDELVSKEFFQVQECNSCNLRITNPRPADEQLGKYYQSEEYISHSNQGDSLINRIYKLARVFTLRSKRKLIQKGAEEKTLLDIGCGTGHFLAHCQEHDWKVTGVEPDDGARAIATNSGNLRVVANLDDIKEEQYDVITLWHVLEHLPNPEKSLTHIKQKLKKEGTLYIAVPNYLSYDAQKFKEQWAAYDVPRHLYHFTPKSLDKLADNTGLIIERKQPMWLDSFYISLMSNQHIFNNNKPINSFITGLLSNIYALKTKNYSSIIYQLKKSAI